MKTQREQKKISLASLIFRLLRRSCVHSTRKNSLWIVLLSHPPGSKIAMERNGRLNANKINWVRNIIFILLFRKMEGARTKGTWRHARRRGKAKMENNYRKKRRK